MYIHLSDSEREDSLHCWSDLFIAAGYSGLQALDSQ